MIHVAFPRQASTVSRGEQALWTEQWILSAKQLNQWDTLLEYSRMTDNPELAIDSLWRLSDWTQLREQLAAVSKAQVTSK